MVVGGSIGAAVDRSCTFGVPTWAGGALCDATTRAVTRAPSAASNRSLVTITPPLLGPPLRVLYKSLPRDHSQNKNLFYCCGAASTRAVVRLVSRGNTEPDDRATADAVGGVRLAHRAYGQQARHRIA